MFDEFLLHAYIRDNKHQISTGDSAVIQINKLNQQECASICWEIAATRGLRELYYLLWGFAVVLSWWREQPGFNAGHRNRIWVESWES